LRWKLVVITSLVAALVGVGVTVVTLAALRNVSLREPYFTLLTSRFTPLLYVVPTNVIASIFVYRHTARRRKLQAAITTLLALVMALALYAGAVFFLMA
jgi:hypothetical protein